MEIRALQHCELRALGNRKLVGYAAVFNQLSENLRGFRERIRPGAFRRTLQTADVRALMNHDPSMVLGRNKSGTLQLNEDNHGLLTHIDLPDTTVGHDLYESVKRGDINSMSCGFRVVQDTWPQRDLRELVDVDLFDVSVVTCPAYPQTAVSVRGSKLDLSWYMGAKSDPIIVLNVSDQERLKLRLRLAQSLK